MGSTGYSRSRADSNSLPKYAMIASGVILVLAGIVAFASNGAKKDAPAANPDTKTIAANNAPAPVLPVTPPKHEEPRPVERVAEAAPPSPSSPAPVTKLLPPPQKPPEPAPVDPPEPKQQKVAAAGTGELEYGPWQDLIKDNKLDGWQFSKGKWDVVDGVMVSTDSSAKGAVIETVGNYDNFELHYTIWIENMKWVEAQVRSYGNVWLLRAPQKTWQDVTIVANGSSVTCTLSAGEVEMANDANGNTTGNICFYIHKDGILKVKDIKLRTIKTK